MNRYTILFLLFSSTAFGQQTTSSVRPGVQIATVFSSALNDGITPAFTLNFRRAMLSVGPRLVYRRSLWERSNYYDKDQQIMMDAAFRYYLMPDEKIVKLFLQAGVEYRFSHITYGYDYNNGPLLTYGPIFDYSFRGEWDKKTHYLSVYGGFGLDVRIWKQLSAFVSCGAGTSFSHTESVLNNVDADRVEYSSKGGRNGKFSWIASAGLGYRF